MRQSFGDWDPCEKSQKMRAWIDPHITVWFLLGNGGMGCGDYYWGLCRDYYNGSIPPFPLSTRE